MSRYFRAGLYVSVVFAMGCHNMVQIRPSELPRLNDSYQRQIGVDTGNPFSTSGPRIPTPIVESSTRHVEAPDGRMVEIEGRYNARITLDGGESWRFNHPVRS